MDSETLINFLENRTLTFEFGWKHSLHGYCDFHGHPYFEIVYHVSGQGRTESEHEEAIDYREGSVIIYPPYCRHNQLMNGPGEDICLHLGTADEIPDALNKIFHLPSLRNACLREELHHLGGTTPRKNPLETMACHYRATSLFLNLILAATEIEEEKLHSTAEKYADRANEYLKTHFQHLKEVSEIARFLSISEDYLRHVYRRKFGVSIKRTVAELRIQKAKDLLVHSALPLKGIAHQCGFDNERYFCTSFKSLVGCTPGNFRARFSTQKACPAAF